MRKKLLRRMSGCGTKYLTIICCFLLVFGWTLMAENKRQEAVPVYAEEGSVADFVSRLYEYVLEREAEEDGLTAWTKALQNGEFTGAEVAKGFIMSDEFLNKDMTNKEFVQILYRAFFGREADANGLTAWVDLLDQGYRKSYVFAGFANSVEFGTLCNEYEVEEGSVHVTISEQQPGLSDEEYNTWLFVERLYTEVLGRTPDETGLGAWADYLQDGTYTGAEVAEGFILSVEFENKDVSSEEYVQVMYKAFFGREADQSGLEAWVDVLENQFDKRYVFAGFANSAEFGNLCDSYDIKQGEVSALEVVPQAPYEIANKDEKIYLCWNAVEDMTLYGVWRSEGNDDGEPGQYVWLGNTERLEFYDANVVDGTTYYYKITAFDTDMQVHSKKSEAVSITYEDGIQNSETADWFYWEELWDGTLAITGVNYGNIPATDEIVIPAKINGKRVSTIRSYAIAYCDGAWSLLVIPEGITTIEANAIACDYFVRIWIPSTVNYIGGNAFLNCTRLEEFVVNEYNLFYTDINGTLYSKDRRELYRVPGAIAVSCYEVPDGITILKDNAFADCKALVEVKIPASVQKIGNGLFNNCSNLETLTVSEENQRFCSNGACILSKDGGLLYAVAPATKELVIPATVEYIYSTTILSHAKALESIIVEEGNQFYCVVDGVLFNESMTKLVLYPDKKDTTTYEVPETVIEILDYAFSECNNLVSVTMPDTVRYLGWLAFANCTALEEVRLSSGLSDIYESVFLSCNALKEIVIPEGVTRIAESSFAGCHSLTKAVIPDSVTYIAPGAFQVWWGTSPLTIYAPAGSYAVEWALSHGYSLKIY